MITPLTRKCKKEEGEKGTELIIKPNGSGENSPERLLQKWSKLRTFV